MGHGGRNGQGGRNHLKAALIGGDALSLLLGHLIVAVVTYGTVLHRVEMVAAGVVIGLWAMRSQGLFLARISAVRTLELTRIARALVLLAGAMIVLDRGARFGFRMRHFVTAALLSGLFIVVFRSAYRSWVATKRSHGQLQRSLLVIGTDAEAARLIELFDTHTEVGMRVVGVVGDHETAQLNDLAVLWVGDTDDIEGLAENLGVSGVVVSPGALPSSRLRGLIHNLQGRHIHVHIATGISGIDARRLRSLPLSHEPLLYVEAPSLSRLQLAAKRGFDIVMASIALLVASPVMIGAAILIKLGDRGPVFFRQQRVGRGGVVFNVLKFRTMRVDAEAQLAALQEANERKGPLFKMERDPRVTRIGRILRETSLDELPQLVNVLRGQMSLVGPRPALPSEVEQFSADLRKREEVLPGITGLWQIEARDKPSFEAYRRLDLFYVENWSIGLDLMIVLGTIEHLAARIVSFVARRDPDGETPTATGEMKKRHAA